MHEGSNIFKVHRVSNEVREPKKCGLGGPGEKSGSGSG